MKYFFMLIIAVLACTAYWGVHANELRKRDCFHRGATIMMTSTDSWICVNKEGRVVM